MSRLKADFGYDDSLDVFGVHGVGSTLGLLVVGCWRMPRSIRPSPPPSRSMPRCIARRRLRAVCQPVESGSRYRHFAAVATYVLLKVVDRVIGLRVSEEEETVGLDLSQHGESAYND